MAVFWRKNKQLTVAISLILLSILAGCSQSEPSNNAPLKNYQEALFSNPEFINVNNGAEIDQYESYEIGVSAGKVVFGSDSKYGKVNWGIAKSISPTICTNENFWSASTDSLVNSPEFKGLVTKLTSIKINSSNFIKSRASIMGQYSAVFNDELYVNTFFETIKNSLASCGKDVSGEDSSGETFQVTLKNAPTKNFKYYELGENAVMRTAEDGLIMLDVFVKTKYSVTLFKLFINDMNLPNRQTWSILNELLQQPIETLCQIEECVPDRIQIQAGVRLAK